MHVTYEKDGDTFGVQVKAPGKLNGLVFGYNETFKGMEPVPTITTSLNIDYAGSAKLGDWIEIEVDVQKVGRNMAFANSYFYVGSKRIARASAVFNVISM